MGYQRGRGGPRRPRGIRGGPRRRRKKPCIVCTQPRRNVIDYKNVALLGRFVDDRGRIRKARQSGACRKHQSQFAGAIKLSREMALLAYTLE